MTITPKETREAKTYTTIKQTINEVQHFVIKHDGGLMEYCIFDKTRTVSDYNASDIARFDYTFIEPFISKPVGAATFESTYFNFNANRSIKMNLLGVTSTGASALLVHDGANTTKTSPHIHLIFRGFWK